MIFSKFGRSVSLIWGKMHHCVTVCVNLEKKEVNLVSKGLMDLLLLSVYVLCVRSSSSSVVSN